MQAAEVAGNIFWIAEQEQYAPAILTAQQLITQGKIGDTVTLHTMGAGGGGRRDPTAVQKDSLGRRVIGQGAVVEAAGLPAYYEPMEGEDKFRTGKLDKAWRSDKSIAGGGVIIDGGSHTIRPMRMLMQPHCGNIVAVAGITEAFDPRQEGENYTRTIMRFANGRVATLEMGGCDRLSFSIISGVTVR